MWPWLGFPHDDSVKCAIRYVFPVLWMTSYFNQRILTMILTHGHRANGPESKATLHFVELPWRPRIWGKDSLFTDGPYECLEMLCGQRRIEG